MGFLTPPPIYNRLCIKRLAHKNCSLVHYVVVMMVSTMILCINSAIAQERNIDSIFSCKVYFQKSSSLLDKDYSDNRSHLDSIASALSGKLRDRVVSIEICGSASPEGTVEYNLDIAHKRAEAVADALGTLPVNPHIYVGLPDEGSSESWSRLRNASVNICYKAEPNYGNKLDEICRSDSSDTLSPLTTSVPHSTNDTKPIDNTVADVNTPIEEDFRLSENRHAANGFRFPKIILGTNLLYDLAITPNIGVGVCFHDKFTIYADWMHAWWSNRGARRYWRIYGGDVELRMQLGHGRGDNPFSGHYLGLYGSMVTYDFQFGRSHTGVIADKYNYAVGVSYGYSLPIARRLNLDFGIGIGYMWGRYMKQHLMDEHDVLMSVHKRSWFGPTRVEVGLSWLIGPDNINGGKGGHR